LIDAWLTGAIATLILFAMTGETSPANPEVQEQLFISVLVASASFQLFFLMRLSATPGKMLLNIYVSDVFGQPVRPASAAVRYAVFLLSQMVFFGLLISGIFVVTDPMRQALHDRLAGTLVVRGRPML